MNNFSSNYAGKIKQAPVMAAFTFMLLVARCRNVMGATMFTFIRQISLTYRPILQVHAWQTLTIQPYIHIHQPLARHSRMSFHDIRLT